MSTTLARVLMQVMRPERTRLLRELDRVQWLPASELATMCRDRLTAILRRACTQVPFYQEHCRRSGLDPLQVGADDLASFPTVSKRDMMADIDRFLAADTGPGDRLPNATGGSTGIWFQFFIDRTTLAGRTANDLRGRTWTGWHLGDKQALLWGHPRDNKLAHSVRGRILARWVHRSVNLNAYDMDDKALAQYARCLRSWRPVMILGYSSALAFLADYLAREKAVVSSPRGIISSAETLTDRHRESIEGTFGCKLLNRYGSREFGNIAQQCEQVAGMHIFSDRVFVEILRPDGLPCAPGERGEIVVTDFFNRVMPFVRYRTGDLARTETGLCSCGRGFPLLAAVEGRTSELIVGKNGKYYSCQSPRLFGADIPGIGQMQLIQETLQELEIKIVPDGHWTEDCRRQLLERMTGLLGEIDLKITLVKEIPPAPSGKYPFTISKVSPFST